MMGIVSFGTYIPRYRLRVSEIAQSWHKDPDEVVASLGVVQKAVPAADEDAVTLALEAAHNALGVTDINKETIDVVLVGSESHPYAVNPTSTIVGELLGIGNNYLAADLEFACKAATAGLQLAAGLIGSKKLNLGLIIGSDTAQSKPHDILEYTAAAASAAYLMGNKKVICELVAFGSYSSDTPDFWRRDGMRYPSHAGRFTGKPAYFRHVWEAAVDLLHKTKHTPSDFSNCVFHMPNGKFAQTIAQKLGFSKEQLAPSLTVNQIGNPYSASSLIGLAAVLDHAKAGDLLFHVSYGSGAGSDAFVWRVTKDIVEVQNRRRKQRLLVADQIKNTQEISYLHYLQQTHKI